jgi:peptide subunit release factor RF-3
MRVADRVAREWRVLSEGQDRSYGNGIAINNHTQNTFVTTDDDRISAIFIPRDRRKIDTSCPGNLIQKKNAGVLEMMGYFIIDNPDEFEDLELTSPEHLKDLGDSWLSELAPTATAVPRS